MKIENGKVYEAHEMLEVQCPKCNKKIEHWRECEHTGNTIAICCGLRIEQVPIKYIIEVRDYSKWLKEETSNEEECPELDWAILCSSCKQEFTFKDIDGGRCSCGAIIYSTPEK